MNGLDARKQDVGPIDPPEPELTENEREQMIEEALLALFEDATDHRVLRWCKDHLDRTKAVQSLIEYDVTGENDGIYAIVDRLRAGFLEYALHAQEFDHIRREVEES